MRYHMNNVMYYRIIISFKTRWECTEDSHTQLLNPIISNPGTVSSNVQL